MTPCCDCVVVVVICVVVIVVVFVDVVTCVVLLVVVWVTGCIPIEKFPEYVKVTLLLGESRYPPAAARESISLALSPPVAIREALGSQTNTSVVSAGSCHPPDLETVVVIAVTRNRMEVFPTFWTVI